MQSMMKEHGSCTRSNCVRYLVYVTWHAVQQGRWGVSWGRAGAVVRNSQAVHSGSYHQQGGGVN